MSFQQLREASEQRKELERQHAEALAQLREKKEEVGRLNLVGESDKKKSADTIEALQVRCQVTQLRAPIIPLVHQRKDFCQSLPQNTSPLRQEQKYLLLIQQLLFQIASYLS